VTHYEEEREIKFQFGPITLMQSQLRRYVKVCKYIELKQEAH